MRTLHVIPSIAGVRGGPTHAVLNTVRVLRERGVDAQIATTNDAGPGKTMDVPAGEPVEHEGVPVRFFPTVAPALPGPRVTKEKTFLFSPALTRWLYRSVRDFDAVETRYLFSYPATMARAVARMRGVPYVIHPTGMLDQWALSQGALKKRVYGALIERRNLRKAAAIQCSSRGEVGDVRKYGVETRTFITPVGVHPRPDIPGAAKELREKYGIPQDAHVVLFLSRVHLKKRPELIIEAQRRLTEKGRGFHFIIAGTGEPDYVEQLEKLVADSGLTGKVTFAGFIAGRDKDLAMQGADIFILPSYSENFGVVVIEAMAAGTPVIISSGLQIAPDIKAAGVGLVVEGEPEPLTAAVESLLESPELRDELGSRGKEVAQRRYSWESIGSELITVYTQIREHGRLLEDRDALGAPAENGQR